MSNLTSLELKPVLDRLRKRFVEFLSAELVQHCSLLYAHENGVPVFAQPSFHLGNSTIRGTIIVVLLNRLEKLVLRSVEHILLNSGSDGLLQAPKELTETIKVRFLESVLVFLDGVHFLVFHPNAWSVILGKSNGLLPHTKVK